MWELASTIRNIPAVDRALVVAVVVAGLAALIYRRRGGRYRELPGWSGFWLVFSVLLICLSRLNPWISFSLLAMWMFASLRAYFFVAPVRRGDRYAVLATYLAIPFSLWPAFIGSNATFLATIPVSLFLLIPFFLSVGRPEQGLLDSMGRTLLGVLFFVFCVAHLGLLVHERPAGLLELFGILVLAADLPQRIAGRFRETPGFWRPAIGVMFSLLLTVALGFWIGPWCGLVEEDAGRAGALVAIAVTLGALVSRAVTEDLFPSSAATRLGRAAFLNRMVPAVYAAPVYFHYLNHFA